MSSPIASASASPEPAEPRRLFLSYCRINARLAEALKRDLERADIACWMDTRDLDPCSQDWRAAVDEAIDSCNELLVLVSRESLKSVEVKYEIDAAKKREKRIRRISLLPPEQLPEEERKAQHYDWTHQRSYQKLLQEIQASTDHSSATAFEPLSALGHNNPLAHLDQHCPEQKSLTIAGRPFWRFWFDATAYTSSYLFLPDQGEDLPDTTSLALVLRFSGPLDSRSHEEVLRQRLDAGQCPRLLLIEGPSHKNEQGAQEFHLPNNRPHIWNDALLTCRSILNAPAIKSLSLDLYLNAPALLALRLGLDLDRGRRFNLHQYDRCTNGYCTIDFRS